jgi:hypothetical protein
MMGTVPSKQRVKDEIAKLKELKPNVRHYTIFGDDNWKGVDAVIRVLEEGMEESQVWDRFDPENTSEFSPACAAAKWLKGEIEDDESPNPSDGWPMADGTISGKKVASRKAPAKKKRGRR